MSVSHDIEVRILKNMRDFINKEIKSLRNVSNSDLESEFINIFIRYQALKIELDTRRFKIEQEKILERQNRTTKTCLYSLEKASKKRRLTRKEKKELEKIRLQQAIKKLVEEWVEKR